MVPSPPAFMVKSPSYLRAALAQLRPNCSGGAAATAIEVGGRVSCDGDCGHHVAPPSCLPGTQIRACRCFLFLRAHVTIGSKVQPPRLRCTSLQVLARLLSRVSPGGDSLPDAMFAEPSGPLSAGLLSRTTSWFAPLRRLNSSHGQGAAPWVGGGGPAGGVEGRGGAAGRAAAAAAALQERGSPAPTREALIDALVAGFVSDLECSIIYSASEHMSSQLSFVTSGMAKLAQLDAQIRLEHVAEDLEQLRSRIGYRRPNVPAEEAARDTGARDMSGGVGGGRRGGRGLGRASGGGSGEGDEWKCSLGRENQANGKGGLPVDSADIAAALRRSPALIQRLCTVYMQDFICLGYTLPRECADGRALEWLTPAPFDRPRNAGRRNLRLRG